MAKYDSEQESVFERLKRRLRQRNATPKEAKATYETVLTESSGRELQDGDKDSTGAFQQRPSMGWGPAGEKLETDLDQFLAAARKGGDYSGSAGKLAQSVQRSGFGERYDQHSAEADKLRGGSSPGGSSPARGSATPSGSSGADAASARRAALQQYVLAQGTQDEPDSAMNLANGLRAARQIKAATPPADARTAVSARRQGATGGAQGALAWASSKVGAAGSAETGGENHGKLADYANSRFDMSGQPWCAMFTSMAVTKGGAPSSARTASVAEVRRKALAGEGYQKGMVSSAKPGDLVLFGDSHIGMVKSVDGDTIHYVGGNQSDNVTEASTSRKSVDVVRPKYGKGK